MEVTEQQMILKTLLSEAVGPCLGVAAIGTANHTSDSTGAISWDASLNETGAISWDVFF